MVKSIWSLRIGVPTSCRSFWAPVTGTAPALIESLLGGVRSGMTYGGARNIKELQRKADFVEVGHAYLAESSPRE